MKKQEQPTNKKGNLVENIVTIVAVVIIFWALISFFS